MSDYLVLWCSFWALSTGRLKDIQTTGCCFTCALRQIYMDGVGTNDWGLKRDAIVNMKYSGTLLSLSNTNNRPPIPPLRLPCILLRQAGSNQLVLNIYKTIIQLILLSDFRDIPAHLVCLFDVLRISAIHHCCCKIYSTSFGIDISGWIIFIISFPL